MYEDARLRIMRLIQEDPEMSSRKIAAKVGISNGSAFYILNALVKKGFVKIENFKNNPRKGRYVHLLTPKGLSEKTALTYQFIKRKREEFEQLQEEISSLEQEIERNEET